MGISTAVVASASIAPRSLSVRAESARGEDHDWDPARTTAPLVYVVAGVVVVDQAPQLLALGALGLVCAHRDQPAVDLDFDVGVRRQVVVPGRVALGAGL